MDVDAEGLSSSLSLALDFAPPMFSMLTASLIEAAPPGCAGLCSSRTACGPGESWGKARWFNRFNPSRTGKLMIYDSIYDDLPKKSDDYLIVGVNLKMLVK